MKTSAIITSLLVTIQLTGCSQEAKKDRIYVFDGAKVQIFDGKGARIGGFPAALGGDPQEIQSLTVASAGTVWIASTNTVCQFDSAGKLLRKIPMPPDTPARSYDNSAFTVDRKGTLYIVENVMTTKEGFIAPNPVMLGSSGTFRGIDMGYVVALDENSHIAKRYGGDKGQNGNIARPKAILTDSSGDVFVLDWKEKSFHVFSSAGAWTKTFPLHGPPLEGDLKDRWELDPKLCAMDEARATIYAVCDFSTKVKSETRGTPGQPADIFGALSEILKAQNDPNRPGTFVVALDLQGRLVSSWPVEGPKTSVTVKNIIVLPSGKIALQKEADVVIFESGGRLAHKFSWL